MDVDVDLSRAVINIVVELLGEVEEPVSILMRFVEAVGKLKDAIVGVSNFTVFTGDMLEL